MVSHGLAWSPDNWDGFESAIGGYFRIKFPNDWPENERYDFSYQEWQEFSKEENPFMTIDYNLI